MKPFLILLLLSITVGILWSIYEIRDKVETVTYSINKTEESGIVAEMYIAIEETSWQYKSVLYVCQLAHVYINKYHKTKSVKIDANEIPLLITAQKSLDEFMKYYKAEISLRSNHVDESIWYANLSEYFKVNIPSSLKISATITASSTYHGYRFYDSVFDNNGTEIIKRAVENDIDGNQISRKFEFIK